MGDFNQFNSNLNWNRALTDNVAVGATDQAQRSVFKNDDADFRGVNTSFQFAAGGAYAFDVGNRQLIADAKFGFGRVKDVSESGTSEVENTEDIFGIRGKVGMPFRLYDSELHIVPFVGIEYDKISGDGSDLTTTQGVLGLDLYSSVPCNGWWFNEGFEPNKQFRYTQGTQMWANGTWLRINFGTENLEFNPSGEFENNILGANIGANYSYYIQERLALGVRANLGWNRSSPKDSDLKTTFTDLSITPLVRWHPFADESGADYYLEGSGGILTSKSTVDSGSGSSDNKINGFTANVGIGKFVYLNEFLSLNPFVSYNYISTKDPDSTEEFKLETKGFRASIGVNYSF